MQVNTSGDDILICVQSFCLLLFFFTSETPFSTTKPNHSFFIYLFSPNQQISISVSLATTTVTSMQIALILNLGLDVTALMVSLEMELHVQVKIKHALISHQTFLCDLFDKAQSDKTVPCKCDRSM